MEILLPVIIVGIIGLIAGVGLSLASKFMAVPVDEKQEKIREALPGANCGACGFAGCSDYAKALGNDADVSTSLCPVGGAAVASQIAEIMGVSAGAEEKMVAFVPCSGAEGVAVKRFNYKGPQDCQAAMLFGGKSNKECRFACIGLGNCARACKFGAMHIVNGVAKVDRDKCVGCMACADACPKKIIEKVPYKQAVLVGCRNQDKGAVTRKICDVGCIGCMKCQRECPAEDRDLRVHERL